MNTQQRLLFRFQRACLVESDDRTESSEDYVEEAIQGKQTAKNRVEPAPPAITKKVSRAVRDEEFEDDWNIDIENFEKLFHRFCDPKTELSSIDKKLLYGFWTHRRKFFKNIDKVEAKERTERRRDQRQLKKLASEAPPNWYSVGGQTLKGPDFEHSSSEP